MFVVDQRQLRKKPRGATPGGRKRAVQMTMGTEVPTGCLGLQGFSGPGNQLMQRLRNAHRWRLRICADYVRRLSGCLLTFARPVETGTPPPKRTPEYAWVEVRGIEPLSRTPPVRRNYNHVRIVGARPRDFKHLGGGPALARLNLCKWMRRPAAAQACAPVAWAAVSMKRARRRSSSLSPPTS